MCEYVTLVVHALVFINNDKLIAEKICDIRHYVCKVIRKNTNVFFQLKHFFLFSNVY